MNITEKLFSMQSLSYRDFNSKLIPTVKKERIIGVRTPQLRSFAKQAAKYEDIESFLNELPHKYYEENNLHAAIIEKEKDFDKLIVRLDKFLPFIDNWATCDMLRPKVFTENREKLLPYVYKWIESKNTYTVRFGIGILMSCYLDEYFDEKYLKTVSEVKSEEYYINMMRAWYFATALAKQYEKTLPYIENKRLDVWTHNKVIQKAIESYRITPEQKQYLKQLKIK